jgi:hypothetical protein
MAAVKILSDDVFVITAFFTDELKAETTYGQNEGPVRRRGRLPGVTFADRKGSFREIGPDLYERVDAKGNVIRGTTRSWGRQPPPAWGG